MAKLFKQRILREKLANYEITDFEARLSIIKKWHSLYHDGTLKKQTEQQCEQAFNKDIFQDVLDYKDFTNKEHTLKVQERVKTSSQRPDATLGYFNEDKEKIMAVCEIKDANTALDRSQRREGNLSPIGQAFKYKTQLRECPFVIATNFYEIRLFKDTQLDYELFTLDELVNPENDYFEFRKFYYLLNADNFISKAGQSTTERLLSEIRIEEAEITKAFYAEYKKLRKNLIRNILENNKIKKSNLIPLAVEKAQKIIDRTIFVCFCEDVGLLPENTLEKVLNVADSSFGSTWNVLKGFFEAIDKGSEKLEIPNGYNGGLFKEDRELNNLKIGDDICKELAKLGRYNFKEDLSVNILGHIFEQSITDIERYKSFADEKEFDEKQSKRKKDGIFYTPDYITDYIVKNSLGKYLAEKEEEILDKHGLTEHIKDKTYTKREIKAYEEYQLILQNVKVLDPACGSGAFLVKVFDYLKAENERVGEIINNIFSQDALVKEILQNNIYGVDLNPESVEITKLSLWLKTAQKGKKLATLEGNIKCGNSLIDDPEIAGERAFKWEEWVTGGTLPMTLPATIGSQKVAPFDVIVGNPPYVSSKNENISKKEKEYLNKEYKVAQYQIDTYILFLERGIQLLKNKGKMSYIIPNAWMNNLFLSKVREFLLKNISFKEISIMPTNVFEDATVDTVIIAFSKDKKANNNIKITKAENQIVQLLHNISQKQFLENENFIFDVYVNPSSKNVLQKIESGTIKMSEICEISTGIKEYQVGKGKPPQIQDDKNKLRFNAYCKKDNTFIPELRGKNINRYLSDWQNEHISYGEWIAEPRKPKFFKGERILLRKIPAKNTLVATYLSDEYVIDQSLYIGLKNNDNFDLKYCLCVLNSKLIGFYFKFKNSEFDNVFPQIKIGHFKSLPIKQVSPTQQAPFIEKADLMLSLNKELHKKTQEFLEFIKQKYSLEKVGRKLQKFYELDFAEFKKQLKAKKIPMEEEIELMALFSKKSKELSELKAEIDKQDTIIDEMVFDLYDLSEEEREVVLES